ncbi:ATP-dependent DNA helicase RecG [Candidatus Ichthyocystis hellenicum]|uniref:ATP-dependent DNA helicase RecG n=1 Tax=Candidatus Ichthyocystis hellenicum TaxID=1561003 RepID=UPI000A9E5AEA|nr:ATP-dependent DNA helicase RecG [Candidatus Ichthyocystis hellenicum]
MKDVFSKLGQRTQDKLRRMGLFCSRDLVFHTPLRYANQTVITPIPNAAAGSYCVVEGTVISVESRPTGKRKSKLIATLVDDDEHVFKIIFINSYPSQKNDFALGSRIRSFGEFKTNGTLGKHILHPEYKTVQKNDPLPQSLTAIYPSTAGLSQKLIRKIIHAAMEEKPWIDILPQEILTQYGLGSIQESLMMIHFPPPNTHQHIDRILDRTHNCWKRLKFDELLSYHIALILAEKKRSCSQKTYALTKSTKLMSNFMKEISFELTDDQKLVWKEIQEDLCHTKSMYRLLQGDVGSGKTVIAIMAALMAIESGYQVAFMAPTEILAEQHYIKMSNWLNNLGIRLDLLQSSTPSKKRKQTLSDLSSGTLPLVVGTHSLIQKDVQFSRLALVITDEQHRFGVEQRLSLWNKGNFPHQLLMSATPIPRTLAMTYSPYLQISTIKHLPKGRQPIDTHLFQLPKKEVIIKKIAEHLSSGQQAYWVCPLIEDSEKIELSSVLKSHEIIQQILPNYRIGLLHGKMKGSEKATIMKNFLDHKIDLLVTTTVIEVGIDVPNATMIVIEHAERFGLAQLHQLRGRVGRGSQKSYCLLIYHPDISNVGKNRLLSLHKTQDGFLLAEKDLEIRGPGQIFGPRQSGLPQLRFSDLIKDAEISEESYLCAQQLLQNWYNIADRHYRFWISDNACYVNA